MAAFNREVEQELAQSPGELVCGNPATPFLFLGLIGGALGGIAIGRAAARLITWLARCCGHHDANEAVTLDDGTLTDKVIATEPKKKDLRSEIELLDRLIVQADRGGDDDVARKLINYRAKLEHELGT
jgi:hypothetical protein